MKALMTFINVVRKVLFIISACSIAVTVILIIMGLVSRGIFDKGLVFTEEYSNYCTALMVFAGVGYTMRKGGHINVDLVTQLLPKRIQLFLAFIVSLLGALYVAVLTWQSTKMFITAIKIGQLSNYPLRTPLGYVQTIMAVGLFIFFLEVLAVIVQVFKRMVGKENKENIVAIENSINN